MLPVEPLEDLVTKGLRLAQHFVDLSRRHDAGPVEKETTADSEGTGQQR